MAKNHINIWEAGEVFNLNSNMTDGEMMQEFWTTLVVLSLVFLGQFISNKKEELTAILDHFNIQVLLTFIFILSCNVIFWTFFKSSNYFCCCKHITSSQLHQSWRPQQHVCILFSSWTTQCPFSTKKWVNSSCIQKVNLTSTRYNTATLFESFEMHLEKLI